ncbi:MAG: BatD family protein [Candidatus Omnitrophica bacterium]|nr:BatD family protein [Candidatus Omnitrophota bacterium]
MKRRVIFNLTFIFCLLTFTFCYCDNIQFEVSVDKTKVTLGETIQLNFTFHGTQNIPRPTIQNIENFNINYLGPSTVVSIVNGKVSTSITHIFSLLPLKIGTFTIGPFSVELDGKNYTSKPITIEVVSQTKTQTYDESAQSQTGFNFSQIKDRIFLVLEIDKKRLYLNELTPLVIKLYVNRLAVRDIQFPIIQTEDFSVEKFEQPKQYRQEISGTIYDVVEFRTNLLAIKTGQFLLGPAKIKCNLIVPKKMRQRRIPFDDDFFSRFFDDDIFEDFFGRYEAYPLELNSIQIPIQVLPLPEENKPADFSGAVGNFTLEVEAIPLSVNVGDPITIKMRIKGEGNFDSIRAPKITKTDGFKVYQPTETENENEKIFEQVLIPQSKDIKFIPQINFSFFNPKTSKYQTLSNPPIPINVLPIPSVSQKILENEQKKYKLEEEFGRDIVYLKSSLGKVRKKGDYLYKNFNFWLFQLLIFLIFIIVVIFYFEQKKLNLDKKYARRQFAYKKAKKVLKNIEKLLKEGKTNDFFDIVFKTLNQYLADRFNLSKGVTVEKIEEILGEKNISNDILEKTKTIFSCCDSARYGYQQFSKANLEQLFKELKMIINYFERQKYE